MRHTRVVLAAAHLDHNPGNNRQRNLKSLCQRRRMIHDRPHHLMQRRITYRTPKIRRRVSGNRRHCQLFNRSDGENLSYERNPHGIDLRLVEVTSAGPARRDDQRSGFHLAGSSRSSRGEDLAYWLRAKSIIDNLVRSPNSQKAEQPNDMAANGSIVKVTCKRCSTDNPENSRFCTGCGGPLGSEWDAIDRIIDDRLEQKIRATLKSDFVDQKPLELETSALIAERAQNWGRYSVSLSGYRLHLSLCFFSFLGIKTLSDITCNER